MSSFKSIYYRALLRLFNAKNAIEKEFITGRFGKFDCPEPPRYLLKRYNVEKSEVKGRNLFTISPRWRVSDLHILYLHGGAYVHSFAREHWYFLAALIDRTSCTITAPDYPLAPAHTYMDSFDMVAPVYRELLKAAGSRNMVLMGDSAGGGFALALAQMMKKENTAQPSRIILISPWLDISMANPELEKIDPRDPFLGIPSLKMSGRAYAGETDVNDYRLSPVNGSVEGLGKISIFTGTRDILVADARRFRDAAEAEGVSINYFEYPDMIHVWPILNMPEADRALGQIVELLIMCNNSIQSYSH